MSIWLFEAMDNPGPVFNFFSELGVAAKVVV
jgi:hypothetical protein